SSNTDYSVHPAIAASGNNVYVVWQSANSSIVLRKSTDGGASFGSEIILSGANNISNNVATGNGSSSSSNTDYSVHPAIAVFDDNVYVAWKGASATSGISFTRSTDGGASFGHTMSIAINNTNNNNNNNDTSPVIS